MGRNGLGLGLCLSWDPSWDVGSKRPCGQDPNLTRLLDSWPLARTQAIQTETGLLTYLLTYLLTGHPNRDGHQL